MSKNPTGRGSRQPGGSRRKRADRRARAALPRDGVPGAAPARAAKPSRKVAGDTAGAHSGRQFQSGLPGRREPGRGSSTQGEKQDARGGPAGASQGGAPRGTSRLEPSHAHDQVRKDRARTRRDREASRAAEPESA